MITNKFKRNKRRKIKHFIIQRKKKKKKCDSLVCARVSEVSVLSIVYETLKLGGLLVINTKLIHPLSCSTIEAY